MFPHAPGVQMSTIPEDGVTLKEESEAADEADPDKRNPPQLKDKQIKPDNEFDGAPGKSGIQLCRMKMAPLVNKHY